MKFKTWKVKIKLFHWSWIMASIDTLHIIIILAVKVKVVAFGFAHFQVLFFFFFWGIFFFESFDLSFRNFYPLFGFYYFFIFSKYGKTTWSKKIMYIFTRLLKSIQNYESYIYRTQTYLTLKMLSPPPFFRFNWPLVH